MSKLDKILKKWENKPTFVEKEEVFSVLKQFNLEIDLKRGSHIIVRHPCLINKKDFGPNGEFTIPVKSGQKVRGVYLKPILKAISIIAESMENE